MMGCLLTGVEDQPLMSLRGICWRIDANGRMPDDPKFDPMDPGCFCFDCRNAFDPEGIQDAELVNKEHQRACWTYESLLPEEKRQPKPLPPSEDEDEEDYSDMPPLIPASQNGWPGFRNDTPQTDPNELPKEPPVLRRN
jgi:hypothetical protein